MSEQDDLKYSNVFESFFGRGSEKAEDFATLTDLAMKYENEVQLFFGTREELKFLQELKIKNLLQNGFDVVTD